MPEPAAPALDPNSPPPVAPPSAPPAGNQPPPAAPPSSGGAIDPNAPAGGASPKSSASWGRSWLKEDGTLDHAAFKDAPDDLKPIAKEVERYKSLDEFLKGIAAREALLGKKGFIEPPKADAPKAEQDAYKAHLRKVAGAPDKPEGYGIAKPANVPDGQWNAQFAGDVSKALFEEGASPALAKRLLEINQNYAVQEATAKNQAEQDWYADQDKRMRDVAGKEGMSYDQAKGFAERFARKFGVGAENPLWKNASFVIAAARAGKLMGEDKGAPGADTNDFALASRMSPEQAQKEATAIQTDKHHPQYYAYWNRKDPATGTEPTPAEVKSARETQQRYSRLAYANRQPRGR